MQFAAVFRENQENTSDWACIFGIINRRANSKLLFVSSAGIKNPFFLKASPNVEATTSCLLLRLSSEWLVWEAWPV